jgi:hypothetical protein
VAGIIHNSVVAWDYHATSIIHIWRKVRHTTYFNLWQRDPAGASHENPISGAGTLDVEDSVRKDVSNRGANLSFLYVGAVTEQNCQFETEVACAAVLDPEVNGRSCGAIR